jgi:hypothetical protein
MVKSMDIAGVSQALKKLSSTTTHTPTLQFVENDERLVDNNATINPSNELCGPCSDNEKVASESAEVKCGLFNFQPAWIQKFMTVQWCLVFLCFAGAVQGGLKSLHPSLSLIIILYARLLLSISILISSTMTHS